MSKSIAWVKTERFALFRYHSVPIVLDSKHQAEVGMRVGIIGVQTHGFVVLRNCAIPILFARKRSAKKVMRP